MKRVSVTSSPVTGLMVIGLLLLGTGFLIPSDFFQGVAQGSGIVAVLVAAVRMGRADRA
ncbi:hypothetical protein [Streptomyces sp. CT34]|uniref:hypothetical protein n=1 Tax=Streptomyces sp. CT34 TaxID=1553907 RepID=UPI0012FF22EF|nr:hypothetical protein [Streptomyces sp. CT34]